MDGDPPTDSADVTEQQIALVALERGYFDVPRRTPLAELADELGMGDVELSRRLRRGVAAIARRYRDDRGAAVENA
jgi:predicted DNA binding protein